MARRQQSHIPNPRQRVVNRSIHIYTVGKRYTRTIICSVCYMNRQKRTKFYYTKIPKAAFELAKGECRHEFHAFLCPVTLDIVSENGFKKIRRFESLNSAGTK